MKRSPVRLAIDRHAATWALRQAIYVSVRMLNQNGQAKEHTDD